MELYIHIPFCKKKCKYCDFLSWDCIEEKVDAYMQALIEDIKSSLIYHKSGGAKVVLKSIYIGGGTPGVIDASYIEQILDTARNYGEIEVDAEITIELNPCTVTEEKAARYFNAGINRVSMGVQSFNDRELKLLGRAHNEQDVYSAYKILRSAGFKNINMDLIQGLPGQRVEEFVSSLDKMIALNPEHVSAYELIIEPGTKFYEMYGPENGYEFDEDVQADIYVETVKKLTGAGYEQYEISNYSKKGYNSVHNSGYWTGEPYIGCGLGAVGYFGDRRTSKLKTFEEYIPNPYAYTTEIISPEEKKQEFIYLGMRMKRGISLKTYEEKFGEKFPETYDKIFERYIPEYVIKENDRYYFTTDGFLVSNTILSEFV